MGALTHNGEVLQSLPANASQINFDKTGTNLNSTQTENAIKEVNTKVNTNTDDITQLKSGLTGVNEKTFFGGFYGKYYRTTKSSIDDIVDNVITATSDDAGYFSCENKANIVGFGNRQFVFGWTNTEKTFAWIVVCSFNGISVGTRANASTFTFKSLTS